MNVLDVAAKHGFTIRSLSLGTQKMKCPRCSTTRKNKDDRSLSVRIDKTGIGWRCHHCNWTGGELNAGFETRGVAGKKGNIPNGGGAYGSLHREARRQWAVHSRP